MCSVESAARMSISGPSKWTSFPVLRKETGRDSRARNKRLNWPRCCSTKKATKKSFRGTLTNRSRSTRNVRKNWMRIQRRSICRFCVLQSMPWNAPSCSANRPVWRCVFPRSAKDTFRCSARKGPRMLFVVERRLSRSAWKTIMISMMLRLRWKTSQSPRLTRKIQPIPGSVTLHGRSSYHLVWPPFVCDRPTCIVEMLWLPWARTRKLARCTSLVSPLWMPRSVPVELIGNVHRT
mmetsp:Transcript_8076/g.16241  ORF Transcript_8076/g.16241 Transcript_8076/m.16241 type:complete len:236 (-) Transcript_8076:447-1154(-)